MTTLDQIDLDELLTDDSIQAAIHNLQQNRLKSENPYVIGIIRELARSPAGLHNSWVVSEMEKKRRAAGLDTPLTFQQAVQSSFNRHSVDSSVWRNKGADPTLGLFFSAKEKGRGYWGMDRGRAAAWVRSKFSVSKS